MYTIRASDLGSPEFETAVGTDGRNLIEGIGALSGGGRCVLGKSVGHADYEKSE